MATKSYSGLKAIIISKLQSLKGGDDTDLFAGVYPITETETAGYPCVYVIEKTGGGQILDTHRNQREWQFDMFIQVQINASRTPEEAYAALLDAVDRVIESFDQDPTLLDENDFAQCMWIKVVPAEFTFGNQETAYHQAQLTAGIVDIVNRFAP